MSESPSAITIRIDRRRFVLAIVLIVALSLVIWLFLRYTDNNLPTAALNTLKARIFGSDATLQWVDDDKEQEIINVGKARTISPTNRFLGIQEVRCVNVFVKSTNGERVWLAVILERTGQTWDSIIVDGNDGWHPGNLPRIWGNILARTT